MKSYTDIEQSKKLAEILPLESADMMYKKILPKSDRISHVPEIGNPLESLEWYNKGYTYAGKKALSIEEYCIPCWSLAALLNVLPSVITRQGKRMFLTLEKAGAYNLYYKSPNRLDELWATKEDIIDAFVEMIITLKDMNLL